MPTKKRFHEQNLWKIKRNYGETETGTVKIWYDETTR